MAVQRIPNFTITKADGSAFDSVEEAESLIPDLRKSLGASILISGANGTVQRVTYNSTSLSTASGTQGYLSYVCLLTQTGTTAPTVTVLQNDLGDTVTWTRVSQGNYRATFGNTVYTALKTAVIVGSVAASYADASVKGYVYSNGGNEVQVTTRASAADVDGALLHTAVEIRLYP